MFVAFLKKCFQLRTCVKYMDARTIKLHKLSVCISHNLDANCYVSETYSAVSNIFSLSIECCYESGVHMTDVFDLFSLFLLHTEIHNTCADPESLSDGGPNLITFFIVDEGIEDPNTAINRLSSTRQ